jgi:hypothetical protein
MENSDFFLPQNMAIFAHYKHLKKTLRTISKGFALVATARKFVHGMK